MKEKAMKRILIVEDDALLNKTLVYNLASDGYETTAAFNARTAGEKLRKNEYLPLIRECESILASDLRSKSYILRLYPFFLHSTMPAILSILSGILKQTNKKPDASGKHPVSGYSTGLQAGPGY